MRRSHAGRDVCSKIEGDGRPLVLVHELGGSLESFELVVPQLSDGFRVLRYDQPGCGGTPPLAEPATLAGEAERLLDLVRTHFDDGPCLVAGVAAGAAIAVTAALMRPGAVAALGLCAPALHVAPDRRQYLEERAEQAASLGMAAVADASLDRSYPATLRGDGALFSRYLARFLGTDPQSYAAANRALADADLVDRLPRLKQPCLFLAGRHDLLRPPADVERLARAVPGARYATIESGHIMPMQAPGEFAQHLRDFFETLPSVRPHHA